MACLLLCLGHIGAALSPAVDGLQRRPSTAPNRPPYMALARSVEEFPNNTKVVFKNGLSVIVQEHRGSPIVAVTTCILSGLMHEATGQEGISRLLEALYFVRTSDREADTLSKDIRAIGAILDSHVLPDRMMFSMTAPAMQWKKVLELQADALLNPNYDEKTIGQAAAAANRSFREYRQQPELASLDQLLALGFDRHPIRRGLGGYPVTAPRFKDDALSSFRQGVVNPGRVLLLVVGDVTATQVLNETASLFGKVRAGTPKLQAIQSEGAQNGFRYREQRENVKVPRILFGFHTPPESSEDFYPLEVLRAVLALGEGSILTRVLRDEKKLILGASAEQFSFGNEGFWIAQMEAEPDLMDRGTIAVITELEILRRQELDQAEVERALARLELEFWESQVTVRQRTDLLARFHQRGDWKTVSQYVSRLRTVAPRDLLRVAEKYFRLDNCSLLEVLPQGANPRGLERDTVFKTIQDLLEPSVSQEIADRERRTKLAWTIPSTKDDFTYSEVRYPMQKASILRGPELFIREDHLYPVLSIGLFYAGGKPAETDKNSGITRLMLHSMMQASDESDGDRVLRQLELLGARLVPVVRDDYFGYYGTVISRNAETFLKYLFEILKSPKLEPGEIENQKRLQLHAIALRAEDPTRTADDRMKSTLFGDFYYARTAFGTEASVAAIHAAEVEIWHQQTVRYRNPTVVIIGDTRGTSLAAQFVRNLSGSRYQDSRVTADFASPSAGRKDLSLPEGLVTADARVAYPAPPAGDEDYAPMQVLCTLLAGNGGELEDLLPDGKSETSDISVWYDAGLRGGWVGVDLRTHSDASGPTHELLEGTIAKFLASTISFRDFRAAVTGAVARAYRERQTPCFQITEMTRYLMLGKGVPEFEEYPANLQAVEQEDLRDLAPRIFKPERAVVMHR